MAYRTRADYVGSTCVVCCWPEEYASPVMLDLRRVAVAVGLTAVLAVAFVFAPTSTAHAQYPPSGPPTLVVTPPIGTPGYTVTVTVTNCIPNEQVVIRLVGRTITVTCDPVTLQATTTIVAPNALGPYDVCADFLGVPAGTAPRVTLCASIQVVSSSVPSTTTVPRDPGTPGGNLATSGSSGLGTTSTAGIILLGVGIAVYTVSRMRRRSVA